MLECSRLGQEQVADACECGNGTSCLRTGLLRGNTQLVLVNFLLTFRDNLSVPLSGLKNPKECLLLQKERVECGRRKISVVICWHLKMVPTGCPEKSVRNYLYSLRNSPKERSSHLLRGGSLKSRNIRIP